MKTYLGLIKLIEATKVVYVAVFYPTGTYEWLPVDRTEYLRQLKMISNPEIPFPCDFTVDNGDEVFIHTRKENT